MRRCSCNGSRRGKAIAERRFAALRDALHALAPPRFGKRDSPDKVFTPEKVHADADGGPRAFHALSQARDALMKRV